MKVISLLREVVIKDKDTGELRKILSVGDEYRTAGFLSLTRCPSDVSPASGGDSESIKPTVRRCFPLFTPLMTDYCLDAEESKSLDKAISAGNKLVEELENPESRFSGRVTVDEMTGKWLDFHPNIGVGSAQVKALLFDTFNEAMDEYFYRMEVGKLTEKQKHQEETVKKKFDAIKAEQESRIKSLLDKAEECLTKAHLVEENVKLVEDACLVINTGIQNDLSWADLQTLIQLEKSKGRPIAMAIRSLKLHVGLIEVELPSEKSPLLVDVDIRLGAFANSSRYYDLRKNTLDKLERTKAAFEQAMKSAEAKVRADSKREKRKTQHLVAKRKPFWFEKFNWFISSDRYLVLSGRDMHQNEYLVKRLLKSGDAYAHADLTGASSVIIKGHQKLASTMDDPAPIPHRTLIEAGAFSLCFSKAWESKIVTSAWWVHADQVSKTAPSGEYLATGSFMIRGKKNFLPPAQLVLGFGFMFLLDEESTQRHKAQRLEREALRREAGESPPGENQLVKESKFLEQLSITSTASEDQGEIIVAENLATSKKSQAAAKQKYQPPTPKSTTTSTKDKVRGKHGKQKKLKDKYKDQDEEERRVRMGLIHGIKAQASAKLAESPAKHSTVTPKASREEKVHKQEKDDSHQKDQDTVINSPDNATNELADAFADVDMVIGPSELSVIDCLTGQPTENDTLTGAIAVSAPFLVLQHYKYRVKLMPGTLKRGTAAKTSLSLIFSENRTSMSSRDKELIRSVPDTELNTTMPSKVRIAASGVELSKIKRSSAKSKRAR